jgi:hypothetical protein
MDVSGARWKVPGADKIVGATIPALQVQASTGDGQWDSLGLLKPVAAPKADGDVVTLGDSSFYWQNLPGKPKYTQIRVLAGNQLSRTTEMNQQAPAPLSEDIGSVSASWIHSAGTAARPLNNGLDQAPMEVRITNENSTLPDYGPDSEAYNRLYYTDADDKYVITGLLNPAAANQLVAISGEGQYSGVSGFQAQSNRFRAYVSTTSIGTVNITANLDTGRGKETSSSAAILRGTNSPMTAAGGDNKLHIMLGDQAQVLADATVQNPALYMPSNPADIGLRFANRATISLSSLPLYAPGSAKGGTGGGGLKQSAITVDDVTANITGSDFNTYPGKSEGDKITTSLIAKGTAVRVDNFKVNS